MEGDEQTVTYDDILNTYKTNETVIQNLITFGRSKVIPMIGAGASCAIGFPCWKELLLKVIDEESEEIKESVINQLNNGKYEDAAKTIVNNIGQNNYRKRIANILSIESAPRTPWPSFLQNIPKVFPGIIATLNYDTVLETAFVREKGLPPSVFVPMDEYQKYAIYSALQEGRSALLKIHGSIDNLQSIVLSSEEYDLAYGQGEIDYSLPMPRFLQTAAYENAFLFLGCSLNSDRFMDIFKKLFGGTHFALLELPKSRDEIKNKRILLDKCHISPIWYPNGCNKTEALNLFISMLKSVWMKATESIPSFPKLLRIPNKQEPLSYRSNTSLFTGRDDELNDLCEFLTSPSQYPAMWWAIIGPGGAGKSRLAYELESICNPTWNVNWITNNTPFTYEFFDAIYKNDYRNCLLIIDVDYYGITVLGKWIADINIRQDQKKVRILILSREGIRDEPENGPIWHRRLTDFNMTVGVNKCLYKKELLILKALDERDIKIIVESYLSCVYPNLAFEETDCERIAQRIIELDLNDRPLYSLILADSFANHSDIFSWDNEAILSDAFDREIVSIRKKVSNAFQIDYADKPDLFLHIETLYACAIVGGPQYDFSRNSSFHDLIKKSGLSESDLRTRLENYGITNNGRIPIIKPDIIAEYFYLRYYSKLKEIHVDIDFFSRFFRDLSFIVFSNYKETFLEMSQDEPMVTDCIAPGLYDVIKSTENKLTTAISAADLLFSLAYGTGDYQYSLEENSLLHPLFTYYARLGLIAIVDRFPAQIAIQTAFLYREKYAKRPNDAITAEIYVSSCIIVADNHKYFIKSMLSDFNQIYLNHSEKSKVCVIIRSWVEEMTKYNTTPFPKELIPCVLLGNKRQRPYFDP